MYVKKSSARLLSKMPVSVTSSGSLRRWWYSSRRRLGFSFTLSPTIASLGDHHSLAASSMRSGVITPSLTARSKSGLTCDSQSSRSPLSTALELVVMGASHGLIVGFCAMNSLCFLGGRKPTPGPAGLARMRRSSLRYSFWSRPIEAAIILSRLARLMPAEPPG